MRLRSGADVLPAATRDTQSVSMPPRKKSPKKKTSKTVENGIASSTSHHPTTVSQEKNIEDRVIDSSNKTNNVNSSQGISRKEIRAHSWWVMLLLKLSGLFMVIMYFGIPAFVKLNPWIMAEVTFAPRVRWPPFLNLSNPQSIGLNNTIPFTVNSNGNILGAWHILPESYSTKKTPDHIKTLSDNKPIFIYLHGQAGTRAVDHRVQLYHVLTQAHWHVITFDYSGFGDSDGWPTETGVVEDSLAVYHWVKQYSKNSPVYLWGHSLGSAIATKVARQLCKDDQVLSGLVLEAPFNNIHDAVWGHPLAMPFRVMPYFTWVFVEALKYNNILFETDTHIGEVTSPVLILHAEDDALVPLDLGKKVYEAAIVNNKAVTMKVFDASKGYGHKHIHKDPGLSQIVRRFVESKPKTENQKKIV